MPTPQNGEELGDLTGTITQLQGALISLFNFFGKAPGCINARARVVCQHYFLLNALRVDTVVERTASRSLVNWTVA